MADVVGMGKTAQVIALTLASSHRHQVAKKQERRSAWVCENAEEIRSIDIDDGNSMPPHKMRKVMRGTIVGNAPPPPPPPPPPLIPSSDGDTFLPTLVVTPAHLCHQWASEMAKFASGLVV